MKKVTRSDHNPVLVLIALLATLSVAMVLVGRPTNLKTQAATDKLFCTNLAASPDSGVAPLSSSLTISGYASKGSGISKYKFVFGDGTADVISQTATVVHSYASPGAYLAKGFLVDKQGNPFGGTGNCQKTISPREGTIVVDKTSVVVTMDAKHTITDLIYGPGFSITSEGATGFQIKYNEPTSGQGFDISSGGISPNQTVNIRSYINANKPNGIYTGSAIVQYSKDGWFDGPTVTYTITLTD